MYLARVIRVDPDNIKPKKKANQRRESEDSEDPLEEVKLVDGWRGEGQQMIYFTRRKLLAGEYLLFYRAGFIDKKKQNKNLPTANTALDESTL